MRLKFRAWNKNTKQFEPRDKVIIKPDGSVWYWWQGERFVPADEVYEICLSTGMKDRNGKEMYEGDIIELYNKETGQKSRRPESIEWIAWGAAFNISVPCNNGSFLWQNFNLEVIGNKFEHPHLLRGETT